MLLFSNDFLIKLMFCILSLRIRSVVEVCGGSRWFPPLLPSQVDSALVSNEMEIQLRTLTEQHREVSE